jgi:hypothetical protein
MSVRSFAVALTGCEKTAAAFTRNKKEKNIPAFFLKEAHEKNIFFFAFIGDLPFS